jgi:hypothetical protein
MMVTYLILALSFVCLIPAPLAAQAWMRGSVYLHTVEGQVLFSELGQSPVALESSQLPVSSPAQVNCEAPYGSSVFLSTSNRSQIYFEGEGSFTIERLEQSELKPEAWQVDALEPAQSRMILNFRAGSLILDNRKMLESSQCLVETPLGRLSIKRALWQMDIAYDPRSQIYDFTIICSSGRLRFTDLQGQQYTLRAGQRLAGAGSRTMPSIEVGERTLRSLEQMERFQALEDLYTNAVNDVNLYLEHLKDVSPVAFEAHGAPLESQIRPIVIDYANEPRAVTPFRGELASPSASQADLF